LKQEANLERIKMNRPIRLSDTDYTIYLLNGKRVTCPYGLLQVGEVTAKDYCTQTCAAYSLTTTGGITTVRCEAGKFIIGFIEAPKDV
jgi:hypothetical protein